MPSTRAQYNDEAIQGQREAIAELRRLLATETDSSKRCRIAIALLKVRPFKKSECEPDEPNSTAAAEPSTPITRSSPLPDPAADSPLHLAHLACHPAFSPGHTRPLAPTINLPFVDALEGAAADGMAKEGRLGLTMIGGDRSASTWASPKAGLPMPPNDEAGAVEG